MIRNTACGRARLAYSGRRRAEGRRAVVIQVRDEAKRIADPAEEAACLAAMEECPVEAIGNDG